GTTISLDSLPPTDTPLRWGLITLVPQCTMMDGKEVGEREAVEAEWWVRPPVDILRAGQSLIVYE
ncbi:hypothetical protein KIPB_012707, partial [Kipferlia bialata]